MFLKLHRGKQYIKSWDEVQKPWGPWVCFQSMKEVEKELRYSGKSRSHLVSNWKMSCPCPALPPALQSKAPSTAAKRIYPEESLPGLGLQNHNLGGRWQQLSLIKAWRNWFTKTSAWLRKRSLYLAKSLPSQLDQAAWKGTARSMPVHTHAQFNIFG